MKKKFVLVFVIAGKIKVEYGWAYSPSQFVRLVHLRVEKDKKYENIRKTTTKFINYECREITGLGDAEVLKIVGGLKRLVGQRPVE